MQVLQKDIIKINHDYLLLFHYYEQPKKFSFLTILESWEFKENKASTPEALSPVYEAINMSHDVQEIPVY